MMTQNITRGTDDIILYKSDDGSMQIDVQMQEETVWLNLNQIAELFERDKSVISRHIKNVYETGELERNSTVAKFATVQKEGGKDVKRMIELYNLDMILSVGYRVNSKRGTQFRIWATNVLRQHLLQGYTLHQKRLQEKGYRELQQAIDLVRATTQRHQLNTEEAGGILHVITGYMQTWLLLRQYDEGEIAEPQGLRQPTSPLSLEDARQSIAALKDALMQRREASSLFGQERGEALEAIIGNLAQTFDGAELYPTVEQKAAHLLYFVIKDHPFTDGNKRCAVLLFLQYLNQNGALPTGESSLHNSTLVSLALLIAESDPKQKDVMLRMILQFLAA